LYARPRSSLPYRPPPRCVSVVDHIITTIIIAEK
jgi:hypothetical protein